MKQNKLLSLHIDLKIPFSLQYGKFPSVVLLSLVLKFNEVWPKYGKTKVTPLLKTMKGKSLKINDLYIVILIYSSCV